MTARVLRVAVVLPVDGASCHPQLDATGLEVVAEVHTIADLLRAPAHEHEVALVGCTAAQLSDPHFRTLLARLARSMPTVLVAPRVTRTAAAVAGRARALGLTSRDMSAERLSHVVRSAAARRIAYPPEALAVLLRMLPPLTARRASLSPHTEFH